MTKEEVLEQLHRLDGMEEKLEDILGDAPNDEDLEENGFNSYIDVYAELANVYNSLRNARRI